MKFISWFLIYGSRKYNFNKDHISHFYQPTFKTNVSMFKIPQEQWRNVVSKRGPQTFSNVLASTLNHHFPPYSSLSFMVATQGPHLTWFIRAPTASVTPLHRRSPFMLFFKISKYPSLLPLLKTGVRSYETSTNQERSRKNCFDAMCPSSVPPFSHSFLMA